MLLTLCIGRSLEYIKQYPKQQRKKEKKDVSLMLM